MMNQAGASSFGDIRSGGLQTPLIQNQGTGPSTSASASNASFALKARGLGQRMLSACRAAVPAPIQRSWVLGGNGVAFISAWGGVVNRYMANAGKHGFHPAAIAYRLSNAKLSQKVEAKQKNKQYQTNQSVATRFNGVKAGISKQEALTGKPVYAKIPESKRWNTLEETAKGLFIRADTEAVNGLCGKVRDSVAETAWLDSKVKAWLPRAMAEWQQKQLAAWVGEKTKRGNKPTEDQLQAKRAELEGQAGQVQGEVELGRVFNFRSLLVLNDEGRVDSVRTAEEFHNLIDLSPSALKELPNLPAFLKDKEALSGLSALILRGQRESEHAQTQLLVELARHVSKPAPSMPSNQSQVPADKVTKAIELLQRFESGDTNLFENDVFKFKCGLAMTPNGMDALLCLENKQGWSTKHQEMYCNMLEVCAYLKMELNRPDASLMELLRFASQRQVHYFIGAKNDDPLRLAFQALVHSANELTQQADVRTTQNAGPLSDLTECASLCNRLTNAKLAKPACKAGYVAWCNGFQTSGEGTEFNAALYRLFKFKTYYHRSTSHGDRTAWNLTRDLVRQIRKVLLGDKKDPLLGLVSTGDMGSGFNWRVQDQREQFLARLGDGTVEHNEKSVLGQLKKQLGTRSSQAEARQKILAVWQEKGARSFRVHVGDTAGEVQITKQTLDAAFGRKGLFHFRGPKVRLRTLEKWAVEAYGLNDGDWKKPLKTLQQEAKETAREQSEGLTFLADVNLLRCVANGGRLQGKDSGNLFQFSDLKNMILGRPPRKTVDKEMIQDVFLEAAKGGEVISSVDLTYRGLDLGSIANLGLGKLAFGGLIANFSTGRDALLQWGDGIHGTEMIMGSMKHVRTEWGVRFGLSFAKFDKFLKFGPFASYSKAYDRATTGSKPKDGAVAILIPQDRATEQVEGQKGSTGSNKQIAEELTKFLIDFADPESPRQLNTITELWQAWSEKFDDPSRISLGFRALKYEGEQTRVEGGVAARVKWKDKYHGAVAGLTYVGVKGIDNRADKAGRHQVTRSTHVNEKFLTVSAGLSEGSETMWSDDSMSAGTRAIPLVGVGMTLALDTENAITRLISEHGKVNPVETNRDMVFADTKSWMNHLGGGSELEKDAWLYKKTASGYKPTTYKAWDGEVFSEVWTENAGVVFKKEIEKEKQGLGTDVSDRDGLARARVLGRLAVDTMVNEAHQHGPIGSNAKTTLWVLHPAAAEELTSIRSLVRTFRTMLASTPDRAEQSELYQQIHAANQRATEIMCDPMFWQTKWASSANTVSKRNALGVSFGLRFGNASFVSSRPKTHRVFFSADVRKEEANYTTGPVLRALAAPAA